MRFLLLARARTTGMVRLLSDRAYDTRSAAVDAASSTAESIDLADDEVLAVDLDAAGPVLVLRLPAAVPEPVAAVAAPVPEPAAPQAVSGAPVPRPGVVTPESVAAETAMYGDLFAPVSPAVRLQPRFPLFGIDEEPVEEDLAASLRRIARRMEVDLTSAVAGEWSAPDDSWDARTLDDYALPDDAHLSGAAEEGRLRGDAAVVLLRADDARSEEDGPATEADTYDDLSIWAEAAPDGHPVGPFHLFDESDGDERGVPDEPVYQWMPETPRIDDLSETPVEFSQGEAGIQQDPPEAVSQEEETATLAEPVEVPRWEPEPYRPSSIDFAMWVCADCVYQRTCRKAGVATPATCGNFQWKSF